MEEDERSDEQDREQAEVDPLLEAQQGKGYGEDEGEREESLGED